MPVTKRIRFEILRRDEHTCQYCGGKAPDVELTVDHVVPVALGGGNEPSNLVAACRDCNAGKSSIQPDSPLVKQVSDHAAAYALGMLDKMTRLRADLEREAAWAEEFQECWNGWVSTRTDKPWPLPHNWKRSVVRWRAMGVPDALFEKAIEIAMTKQGLVGPEARFAYMAGVIWKTINEIEVDYDLQPEHAAVGTEQDLDDARTNGWSAGFSKGYNAGYDYALEVADNQRHPGERALLALVDGKAA